MCERASFEVNNLVTSSPVPLLRTPLFNRHLALGARMAPFAGFEMPIMYRSIAEEHNAVRSGCGIFDVSHMGRLRFSGTAGHELLERLTTIHVASVDAGTARYGFILTDSGGILDDVILFATNAADWVLVVNAGNRFSVVEHIRKLEPHPCFLDDTESTGMVAVQGPTTRGVLRQVMPGLGVPERANRVIQADWHGTPVVISTTGYTGEDGVEIIAPSGRIDALWDSVMEAGAVPAGLGARDTLRLEMGYPLHGHELTKETDPWQAGLGWAVDRRNEEFVGRSAVFARENDKAPRLVALKAVGRGIPRAGNLVEDNETAVGEITSGTFSPSLHQGIALAYVGYGAGSPGKQFSVRDRESESRRMTMEQVLAPFYRTGTRRSARNAS